MSSKDVLAERMARALAAGNASVAAFLNGEMDHTVYDGLDRVDRDYGAIVERLSVPQQAAVVGFLCRIVVAMFAQRDVMPPQRELFAALQAAVYGFQLGHDLCMDYGAVTLYDPTHSG